MLTTKLKCVLSVAAVVIGVLGEAGCKAPPEPTPAASETVATTSEALSGDSGSDAGPVSPSIGSFALYATEAIELNSGSLVSGCSVGVENTTGPFLGGSAPAYFNSGAQIQSTQTLYASSVYLNSGVSLGPIDTNQILGNGGATYGEVSTFPAMPAPPAMPSATAGTTSVTLNSNATRTLSPGAYGSVTVNSGATLTLTGGSYVFSSLTLNSNGTMVVTAATTLSVTGGGSFNSGSFAGPASGSGLTAQALVMYFDTSSGISLNANAQLQALFIATNARVTVNTSKFTGALAAAQVVMNSGATITCQDGFGSLGGGGGSCSGSCDDGNACTTDACSSGTCTHTPVSDGTTCTGTNACEQTYTCQAGTCTGSNPVVCTASDQCHAAGTCNPSTGICSNPEAANGTTCNDSNACTQTDACESGTCTGSNPVTCTAEDQCHTAGTCNPSTGVCSNPTASDGTTCNDGNACTQSDSCQSGTCTGANPVICAAGDQCHAAGTCDPASGACSNPTLPNGTTCNDGNACTQVDSCQAGVCAGSSPVTCTPSDQCHVAGTCNTSTGTCSNPTVANGISCNDGNACTQSDSCQSGTCTGATPVTCTAQDQCHLAGTCNTSTGTCSNPTASNGTACNDGNGCTQTDSCQSGTCTGSNPVTCTASDQCHVAGTCNATTGTCSNPAAANGTTCSDSNPCTQTDTCQGGACTGSNPVTCTAEDQCHVAGTCDPTSGACSNPAASNGTTCNDGNACTQTDSCQGGTCTGSSPVTCTASDQCHTAGTCNTSTGQCSNPTAANGTSCNDGNPCDTNDQCVGGVCAGTPGGCDAGGSDGGSSDGGSGSSSGSGGGTIDGGDSGSDAGETQPPTWPAGSVVLAAPTGPTTAKLTWSPAADPVGVTAYELYQDGALLATVSGTALSYAVAGLTTGSSYAFAVQAGNASDLWSTDGPTTSFVAQVPNPALIAPPLDQTVATTVGSAVSFLYTGADPIQSGVTAAIAPQRVAVLQGVVTDATGTPLPGVAVTIVGHPEYGQTSTRADGNYDMVVNGGGSVTLAFDVAGRLPAERTVPVQWQKYIKIASVALTTRDVQSAPVDLSGGTSSLQIARASQVQDAWGARQATLLLAGGTTAQMTLPSGATQALSSVHMRATEYTVGPNGPAAMPALLPATSGYTYAVALTLDEAEEAGASKVTFSTPVAFYLENFLSFNVGMHVPSGYYDHTAHVWVPSTDGRVVHILAVAGGVATLDIDGSGQPAEAGSLTALGVTSDELTELAQLYTAGQSLWRIPVPHFSDWDFNAGDAPPPGAGPPGGGGSGGGSGDGGSAGGAGAPYPPGGGFGGDCDPTASGCIIDLESQVLGETVPVAGTPYSLNYRSNRVPGRSDDRMLVVPLTSATPPAPLQGVTLEIDIAGQQLLQTFGPTPNQSYTFTWDGNDGYGRPVQGSQVVHVQIGYVYNEVYLAPSDSPNMAQYDQEFGHYSYYGAPATTNGRQVTLLYNWDGTLGHFDQGLATGLGGWSFSEQHVYDPISNTIYFGDGHSRTADTLPPIISVVPGEFSSTPYNLFGQPAGMAVGSDGTIYFMEAQSSCRIEAVAPSGAISTVAGTLYQCGYRGDGGPASQALINPSAGFGQGLAVGPDGSLYLADSDNYVIRKIDANGIITTVAGNGTLGDNANGILATTASLGYVQSIAVAPDGSLYVFEEAPSELMRLLRISTDGYVRVVIESSGLYQNQAPPANVPLSQADILSANERGNVAVGLDGTVYLSDGFSTGGWSFLRSISPGGIFSTVAGNDVSVPFRTQPGDGQVATSVYVQPGAVTTTSDGSVVFYDFQEETLRIVRPDGVITTLAGSGLGGEQFSLTPGGLATQQSIGFVYALAAAPDGSVLMTGSNVAGAYATVVLRVQPPVIGGLATGFTIADETGNKVFLFDGAGRHLETRDALTGATLYAFAYDSAGRLATVMDVNGDVTTVQRDGGGNPSAIVGPFGQATALTVDGTGYLASITNAVGDTYRYSTSSRGLLTTTITPRGGLYSYSYDDTGRFLQDVDPAAGGSTLAGVTLSSPTNNGNVVARTTAMGVESTYELDNLASQDTRQIVTTPDGLIATVTRGATGSNTQVSADGTTTTWILAGDPRFGMQSPVAVSSTVTTPSQLTSVSGTTRSVTLADPTNLLSVQAATTTFTLNGHARTTVFNAAARIQTTTSAAGRQSTTSLDAAGRPVQLVTPEVAPVALTYDAHGRVVATTQGNRTWSQSYDPLGHMASTTDALGNVTTYTHDAIGRLLQQVLPDGRVMSTTYDVDGNLATLTLPSDDIHTMGYTPVDLLASYTPPSLGIGDWATQYTYDADRRPIQLMRPGGVSISSTYDTAGRLATISTAQGITRLAFNGATGQLLSIAAPGGETVTYAYDGALQTGVTWAGPVGGTLALAFDNNFWVTSQTVNGTSVDFSYDADGLALQVGALALTRDAQNGRLTGTTLGGVVDAYTYDSDGLFASYAAQYAGANLYSESVARDSNGRIVQKTETQQGVVHVWGYVYDVDGRLTGVTKDGQLVSQYGYDVNDNRTIYTSPSGAIYATYDAQDRLLTYGSNTYTYTTNGDRATRTNGSGTTTYAYDPFGNLVSWAAPGGSPVDYVVDGEIRRVGKKVAGSIAQGFLYQDAVNPVMQLDGSGHLVSRFVFGSKPNVPDYFTDATGDTFRILSDHLGSPRLVVNAANGSVVEEIEYDEFGNVARDTSPGLTPFGFAGGLYDPDTGLVRFGARDYDPGVGRWTTKDPIRFGGGRNLYGYNMNDPVDFTDPAGTDLGSWLCQTFGYSCSDYPTRAGGAYCPLGNGSCGAGFSPSGGSGNGSQGGSGSPVVCSPPPANDDGECQYTWSKDLPNLLFECHYNCPGVGDVARQTFAPDPGQTGKQRCEDKYVAPKANRTYQFPPSSLYSPANPLPAVP